MRCLWVFTLVSSIFVVSLSSVKPKSCGLSLSCSSSLISASENIVLPDLYSCCISSCALSLSLLVEISILEKTYRMKSAVIFKDPIHVSALWYCRRLVFLSYYYLLCQYVSILVHPFFVSSELYWVLPTVATAVC